MDDSNKYYQSRHFLRLLHRYEKAVSEGHVPYLEADELTDIAEYYMTGKQDAKATQAIQAAIEMHPDSVDPQVFLARQKMFYGQLDEAHSIIDGITEQEDAEVIYIRAELLIKEEKPEEASAFLLEQEEQMQDSLDSYLYDCTSIFMDYDEWELAEEWIERLREYDPNHPQLPILEAELHMGLDNYEEALPMLQKIIDEEPYNSEAWNLLAETYVALEMNSEALEAADYSLAINPQDGDALLSKGNAYMHDGQTGLAIECYKKYLEQHDNLGVEISLGLCYGSTGRIEELMQLMEKAEQHAQNLTDREEELSVIYRLKSYGLSQQGKQTESFAAIKRARELSDESEEWKYDLMEGDICLQFKQTKKAETFFASALEKSPEQGETLFDIAMRYSKAGFNDTAIDLLDDVWTIFGNEEGKFVVPYLANCYLHKNDTENFLKFLRQAPYCDREATIQLFRDRFPDVAPEDYYAYAYKEVHGVFPDSLKEEEESDDLPF